MPDVMVLQQLHRSAGDPCLKDSQADGDGRIRVGDFHKFHPYGYLYTQFFLAFRDESLLLHLTGLRLAANEFHNRSRAL